MSKLSSTKQDQIYLLLCGLLFIMSLIGLRIAQRTSLEEQLFRLAYNLPNFMTPIWLFFTQFGSIFAALGLIVIAWLLKRRKVAAYVTVNTLVAYSLSIFIKYIVARPRPSLIFDQVVVRDSLTFGYGFPSAHVAIATALALTFWSYVSSGYRYVLIIWVGLVAFSRLYLGAHAPLDIIGGAAIGAGSVFAVRIIVRDILKRNE